MAGYDPARIDAEEEGTYLLVCDADHLPLARRYRSKLAAQRGAMRHLRDEHPTAVRARPPRGGRRLEPPLNPVVAGVDPDDLITIIEAAKLLRYGGKNPVSPVTSLIYRGTLPTYADPADPDNTNLRRFVRRSDVERYLIERMARLEREAQRLAALRRSQRRRR